jgi:hypothetical protein
LAAVKKFKRGALKGKKIEFASSERIEEFRGVADDFMLEIFDFLPGEYLITDESSLPDFTEMGSAHVSDLEPYNGAVRNRTHRCSIGKIGRYLRGDSGQEERAMMMPNSRWNGRATSVVPFFSSVLARRTTPR